MSERRKIRERKPRKPFGWLCGIITFCLAMAIGVFCGVDPFTILCRATVCGLAIGLMVRILIDFIRLANIPREV